MTLVPGEKIGPYEIISRHGQGGMATVYKAHHTRLDRYVAIKVLRATFMEDETFLARFEREARIVARLEHPNIVTVYDYSEYKGQPYFVMQFIEGRTLKQFLLKQGVTLAETSRLMTVVAEALDYAHSKDVLHRDIKPSNIIIDLRNNAPYLTDFGLARIAQMGESTISHDMMLGTPFYISPEQARGERELNARADIYSMGVILYEMVTGRVPFSADTPYAIIHGHIYTEPPLPAQINPALPDGVNQVLLKALAKKPVERYNTATEMMADFNAALEGLSQLEGEETVVKGASPIADQAPESVIVSSPQKRVKIETSLDFGDLSSVGRQVESGIRKSKKYVEALAALIDERVESELTGRGAIMREERIRRRVEQRMKKRQEFITHAFIYLCVNGFLWFLWSGRGFPWPIFPTLFWGIGLFSNGVEYYMKYGGGAARREAMIENEVERELRRAYAAGKDKEKFELIDDLPVDVRINDEGELTDSFIDDMNNDIKRQQG